MLSFISQNFSFLDLKAFLEICFSNGIPWYWVLYPKTLEEDVQNFFWDIISLVSSFEEWLIIQWRISISIGIFFLCHIWLLVIFLIESSNLSLFISFKVSWYNFLALSLSWCDRRDFPRKGFFTTEGNYLKASL